MQQSIGFIADYLRDIYRYKTELSKIICESLVYIFHELSKILDSQIKNYLRPCKAYHMF